MTSFDLVTIGAGPGGYVAAIRAAQLGLKTALVERDLTGGTCLNRGCIPTKALLHASELYHEMNRCSEFGLTVSEAGYDLDKMYEYKEGSAAELRSGVEALLKANGVTVFRGQGRILPENQVSITDKEGTETVVSAKDILIATGSRPAALPVPGADNPRVVNSDGLLAAPPAGKRLLIIGGGVIGVEFASVYLSLGFSVTIVEALPQLLNGMDREISQSIRMSLKKMGADLYTGAMVKEITEENGELICHFTQKGKELSKAADTILTSIGRKPVTDGLFDEAVAPEMNRGYLCVDEHFQTSIPHIYAIGDVSGGIQLAHAASAQGIAAVEGICGKEPKCNLKLVPACVYTNPEIATVGMTDAEAAGAGIKVITGKFLMTGNSRTIIAKEGRGFVKLVFRAEDEVIIGAQLMCSRATDMIAQLSQAVANGLTREQIVKCMAAHPTYHEGIAEAAENAAGEAIHIMPSLKK